MINLENTAPEHFWYLIGLIATDGNLSGDGRHISITSKDVAFLEQLKITLGLANKITMKGRGGHPEKKYGVLNLGDVRLYRYLLTIGLTPKKSLTIGKLSVPDSYFRDFFRGVIDGDGNIRHWIHPSNHCEQWELRVYSASLDFVTWLESSVKKNLGGNGVILHRPIVNHNDMHVLKFGKMAARQILNNIYYENALALPRKQVLAKACANSYRGWKRSRTINT